MIGSVFRDREEAGEAVATVVANRVDRTRHRAGYPSRRCGSGAARGASARGAAGRGDPAEARRTRQPRARDRRRGAGRHGLARASRAAAPRAAGVHRAGGRPAGSGDREARSGLSRRASAGAGRRQDGGRRGRWCRDRRHRGRCPPLGARGRRRRVVFAAPVGPPAARAHLAPEADDVVLLEEPSGFLAVGEWYQEFEQVSDEEVVGMLREAEA